MFVMGRQSSSQRFPFRLIGCSPGVGSNFRPTLELALWYATRRQRDPLIGYSYRGAISAAISGGSYRGGGEGGVCIDHCKVGLRQRLACVLGFRLTIDKLLQRLPQSLNFFLSCDPELLGHQ